MARESSDPPPAAGAKGGPEPFWRRPVFWLAIMVTAFFAVSLYSGVVAYADLQTANSTDAGIFSQAVASTTFHHGPPFYESYDCLVKTRCSFLLVHPAPVLYAIVPVFALFPSTLTLFAVRALLVALGAVPLYLLTRRVTGSAGKGLVAAGLYLVWAPGLVGDAFSLHLETLLPLELFVLVLLWQTGRYRWAFAAAVVMWLTFEVYPLFTFLVGAFFLFPYLASPIRDRWRRWRARRAGGTPPPVESSGWMAWLRSTLRVREVQYCIVLMAASAAAYVALATFMNLWGPPVLGVVSPTIPSGISGVFYNNSSPPIASLSKILSSPQLISNTEFWLILYALVAFIPLLAPRTLILSVPWIGWTYVTNSYRFTTLGHQYAMIGAGPIFVGVAYGLERLPVDVLWRPRAATTPEPPTPAPSRGRWRRSRSVQVTAAALLLVGLVAANAALTPIDPLLPSLGVVVGEPFAVGYFDHSLAISPSFVDLEAMIATIPRSATIEATSAIFPLVADDPHAYVLVSQASTHASVLPFNTSEAPEYVLTFGRSVATTPLEIRQNLSDPAVFGLRGYVAATLNGPMFLYERGFTGTAQLFGPPLEAPNSTFAAGSGLTAGAKGMIVPGSASPTGKVIESVSAPHPAGLVARGPGVVLPPGDYNLTVRAQLSGANFTEHLTSVAVHVTLSGFGYVLVNESLPASGFEAGNWTSLEFPFALADPVSDVNFNGYLMSGQFALAIAWVAFNPS